MLDKFYGCGAPLPAGIDGLTVLDLGSGSGRDCYAAAALVGEHGSVIGVDMTPEQLQVPLHLALLQPCALALEFQFLQLLTRLRWGK